MATTAALVVGQQVTVAEEVDGGVGRICEVHEDGSFDIALIMSHRRLKRVKADRFRVGNHAADHLVKARKFKPRVDAFFDRNSCTSWDDYVKRVSVVHLDDLVDKKSYEQVEYVVSKLEEEPPVQILFFQGAIPLQEKKIELFERFLSILKKSNVWSLNLGELNLEASRLCLLRDALAESKVTHMFYECNNLFSIETCNQKLCVSAEAAKACARVAHHSPSSSFWKDLFREILRMNRRKHDLYLFKDGAHLQNSIVHRAVKNWFNPTGHAQNKLFFGRAAAEAETRNAEALLNRRNARRLQFGDRVDVLGDRGSVYDKATVCLDLGGSKTIPEEDSAASWSFDDSPKAGDVITYKFSKFDETKQDQDVLVAALHPTAKGWFVVRPRGKHQRSPTVFCHNRHENVRAVLDPCWTLVYPAGTTGAEAFKLSIDNNNNKASLAKASSSSSMFPPPIDTTIELKAMSANSQTSYRLARVVAKGIGEDPTLSVFSSPVSLDAPLNKKQKRALSEPTPEQASIVRGDGVAEFSLNEDENELRRRRLQMNHSIAVVVENHSSSSPESTEGSFVDTRQENSASLVSDISSSPSCARRPRRTVKAPEAFGEESSTEYTRRLREKSEWCRVEVDGHAFRAKLSRNEFLKGAWRRACNRRHDLDERANDDIFSLGFEEDWEPSALRSNHVKNRTRLARKYVGIVFRDVEKDLYDETYKVVDVVGTAVDERRKLKRGEACWQVAAARIDDLTGAPLAHFDPVQYGIEALIKDGLVARAPARLQTKKILLL